MDVRYYWPKNEKGSCLLCLSDRTKRNLLPIVKKNVVTNDNEDDNIPENQSTKTQIYSDCFSTYQINDFKYMGYYLKPVNHSIWFGYGLFHTILLNHYRII